MPIFVYSTLYGKHSVSVIRNLLALCKICQIRARESIYQAFESSLPDWCPVYYEKNDNNNNN